MAISALTCSIYNFASYAAVCYGYRRDPGIKGDIRHRGSEDNEGFFVIELVFCILANTLCALQPANLEKYARFSYNHWYVTALL